MKVSSFIAAVLSTALTACGGGGGGPVTGSTSIDSNDSQVDSAPVPVPDSVDIIEDIEVADLQAIPNGDGTYAPPFSMSGGLVQYNVTYHQDWEYDTNGLFFRLLFSSSNDVSVRIGSNTNPSGDAPFEKDYDYSILSNGQQSLIQLINNGPNDRFEMNWSTPSEGTFRYSYITGGELVQMTGKFESLDRTYHRL